MSIVSRSVFVVVLLFGVAGCKKSDPPAAATGSGSSSDGSATAKPVVAQGSAAPTGSAATSGSAAGSAAGSGSAAAGSGSAAVADPASTARPYHDLTKYGAFGGKAPILPQLSADGATAVASMLESVPASGNIREFVVVIPAKGKPETIKLTKATGPGITKRLADGGYRPFEVIFNLETANSPVKHGGVALEFDRGDNGGLSLRLLDAKGTELQKQTIAIAKLCGANPRADYVWFDSARKRVLVEVGWELGPHDCNDAPPEMFLLWSTP